MKTHRSATPPERPVRRPFCPPDSLPAVAASLPARAVVARALGEFLILSVMMTIVPLVLAIDLIILDQPINERSWTEAAQHVFILLTFLRFALYARRHPSSRGFSILAAGFFGCMAIREFDSLFDHICHGFWLYPALLLAAVSVWRATADGRNSVLAGIASFVNSRAYYPILFGLLILLVFSRSFGSGQLLWHHLLDDNNARFFKTALQESLELLGYMFLFHGARLYTRREASPRPPPPGFAAA
ncbi:MAG: hypothetical protein GX548_05415 [Lentisphaerae bacterium]|nr:hypothetical protein [Lentisphaerota bacterium]